MKTLQGNGGAIGGGRQSVSTETSSLQTTNAQTTNTQTTVVRIVNPDTDESTTISPAKTTVTVETNDNSLTVSEDDNLLDALLDSGHEIAYQCRGGYCGACRVQAVSGQVTYDELPLAHLNNDEILPCCCRVSEPLKLAVNMRQIDNDKQGDLFD